MKTFRFTQAHALTLENQDPREKVREEVSKVPTVAQQPNSHSAQELDQQFHGLTPKEEDVYSTSFCLLLPLRLPSTPPPPPSSPSWVQCSAPAGRG